MGLSLTIPPGLDYIRIDGPNAIYSVAGGADDWNIYTAGTYNGFHFPSITCVSGVVARWGINIVSNTSAAPITLTLTVGVATETIIIPGLATGKFYADISLACLVGSVIGIGAAGATAGSTVTHSGVYAIVLVTGL